MWKFLHKLQNEPENKRRQFAVVFSISVTVLILFVWVLAITSGGIYYLSEDSKKQTTASTSPITAVKNSFASLVEAVKGLSDISGVIEYEKEDIDTDNTKGQVSTSSIPNSFSGSAYLPDFITSSSTSTKEE